MKKLLMLLMAVLLFAPPKTNAETVTLWDCNADPTKTHPQLYYYNGSSKTLWNSNAATSQTVSSNGVIEFDDNNTLTAVPSNGIVLQSSLRDADNLLNSEKGRYIKLCNGGQLKFDMPGRIISEIIIYMFSTDANLLFPWDTPNKRYGNDADKYIFGLDADGNEVSLSGAARYFISREYTNQTQSIFTQTQVGEKLSCNKITIDVGDASTQFGKQIVGFINKSGSDLPFYRIDVTYTEPINPPTINTIYNWQADNDGVVKMPMFYRSPTNSDVSLISLSSNSKTNKLYYTFSEDLTFNMSNVQPMASGQSIGVTDADVNASNRWIEVAPNAGLSFIGRIPSDYDLDNSKEFTIRAVSYNSSTGATSETEAKMKVKFVRPSILEPDIEKMTEKNKTASAFRFEDGSIYYQGYNPTIYFKNPYGFTDNQIIHNKFTVDYSDPTAATTSELLYGKDGNIYYEFVNGQDGDEPVNGSREVLSVLTYSENSDRSTTTTQYRQTETYYAGKAGGEVVTFKVVSENPAPTVPKMPRPSIRPVSAAKYVRLSGGVYGYISDKINAIITSGNNDLNGTLKYQIIEVKDGVWPSAPDADEAKWTEIKDREQREITGSARVFVREEKEGYETSDFAFIDFSKLATDKVSTLNYDYLLNEVPDASTAITIDVPVRLIGSFKLSDANSTAGKDVSLMFFADKDGNVLRVHNEGKMIEYDDNKYMMFKNLTGVLRKNKEMPELFLNAPSLDYSSLIEGPYTAASLIEKGELDENYPTYIPTFSKTVPSVKDYSKLMYFGPLRWNKEANEEEGKQSNTFYDNDGNAVKLYQRIDSEVNVEKIESELADGVQYRIAGYVGYADGAPVILPRAFVTAPRLLMPNPINPDAAPGSFTTMKVISDDLFLTVNSEGLSSNEKINTKVEYFFCDDDAAVAETDQRWAKNDDGTPKNPVLQSMGVDDILTLSKDELTDKKCTLAARLVNDGFASGVVTVKFEKIDIADDHRLTSIADFKEKVKELASLPKLTADEEAQNIEYFQFHGSAQVRDITDNYLYIRDAEMIEGEHSNEELSAHSMLLYNANGWDSDFALASNSAATSATDDEMPLLARLQEGDIITNFALIPYETGFGNVVSNVTGFGRTVRRTGDNIADNFEPIEINGQDNKVVAPTDKDLMLRFNVRRAQVIREGDDATQSYTYYISLPDCPKVALNLGTVFSAPDAWDIVYSESAFFNLEGVLMLNNPDKTEDEDGRYMLALQDYSVSGATAPDAPTVSLKSPSSKNKNAFIVESELLMAFERPEGAEKVNMQVRYTTDNSDPRTSRTTKIYNPEKPEKLTRTTVVKAYVVANGLPNSEVTQATFTRSAVDSRYIVNFVNGAEAETPYHLTATAKVVAKGGAYAFVRGTQGHYLPIHFDDVAKAKMPEVGQYINDFVAEPNMLGKVVRGARVHGEYADLFKAPLAEKPSNIDEIEAEPEVVETITPAHARRYVKILNVSLQGDEFEDEEINTAAATQWTCITEKGEGEKIEINHTVLEPNFDWDQSEKDPEAYYNIIGFAMIGDKGEIELWPTDVEKVNSLPRVTASFTVDGVPTTVTPDAEGVYNVNFTTYSTVTLSRNNAVGATIYYYVAPSDDEKDNPDDDNLKVWNVYAQPFSVTRTSYIHIKSVAPGNKESRHRHIYMNKVDAFDDMDIVVEPDATKGVATVTLTPKNGLSGKILYSFDKFATSEEYTGPIEVEKTGIIYVQLNQTGKPAGKIQHTLVDVPAKAVVDSDVAGNVEISVEGNVVTVTPAAGATGKIYYSFDNFRTESKEYTAPVTMTETGIFYARLIDGAKEPGAIAHALVVVTPGQGENPSKPGMPGDKVSGAVTLTHKLVGDEVHVFLAPADMDNVAANWTIHYRINGDEEKVIDAANVNDPIKLTEASRIEAYLLEPGMAKGESIDMLIGATPAEIDGIDADRAEEVVSVSGNDIVAPEGSMIFDLMGRRVNPTSLRTGIYIVRTPAGKTFKVRID